MKRTMLISGIVLIFCGVSLSPIFIYGSGIAVIDSYPESNWDGRSNVGTGYFNPAHGQSLNGDGQPLKSVKFYCCKWPGATGTCYVKLYNETHSTAFGIDSVPSGSALATSNGVSLSDIPDAGSWALISFNFSFPVTLTKGARYVVTLEFSDPVHQAWEVFVYMDQSSPTHSGNLCYLNLGDQTWHTNSGKDLIFYAISDQAYDVPDTTGPSLSITSHSNGQHVSASSITLAGAASDSGKGDNGVQQVTVNGARASTGTATGSGTANWNKVVPLNAGANTIAVVAYDNSANHNTATQSLTIYYDVPDTTGPSLSITSHSNGQHASVQSITLAGAASDSGKGDNGIQQVTVNGARASTGTATGSGTANWNKVVPLNAGANTITVVAYDNSTNHNTATQSLTIYYDVPDTTGPSLSITSHSNGQHVSASSITLAGAASDSGKGDNGIQQVTVNGAQASNGTATGSGTANWSKVVSLNAGANAIAVVAYDNSTNHNTTTQSITIYRDAEQISAPKPPKGVSTGYTGTSYNFSTGGTSCNLKHPVEYQFDWKGDGISDLSPWGSALHAKVWSVAGTYQIRARARCSLHPSIESGWSAAIPVSLNPKPFIHVLSPNGGEAWVVGSTHTVSWESGYLNPAGTIYLFYRYDNAWHPIATLPSTAASYDWTIPEISEAVTTPAPTGRIKTTSIWIGNWLGDSWECWNSCDKAFVILHDAWVFSLSSGDRGGVLLDFQEGTTEGTGQFEGYGVSWELGAFGISGAYDFDERGLIRGNYTLFDSYDLTNASVLESGNLTGGLNQQGRLTFDLKTPGGVSLFTMTGNRFFQELVVPKDWTATLTLPRRVKGMLDTLTIEPYQDPFTNEVYPHVFEISGSGIIPDHGSIDMEGQLFITLTTTRRGENLAYGTYRSSGYLSETGVLSGTVNLGLGTFNLTATSSNGTKYTLTGKVK